MKGLSRKEIEELINISYGSRVAILEMMRNGEGHIGGAYSGLDIITVLYNKVLNHRPQDPGWKDRDRFILSAGHKCLALYATLAQQDYFPRDLLRTYNTFDTKVQMHPDEKALPGIEFPTGSLGHGFPVANGIALAGRLDRKDYRVFVMLGDGECDEGTIWESAMSAAHHGLDNLTVIVDKNGLQVNGRTEDVMNTTPLEDKFSSFGWEVRTINGHDIGKIHETLLAVPFRAGKPSAIVADTVKCKGLTLGEDKFEFHHWHCAEDGIDGAIDNVKGQCRKEIANIE
jgi:transketolase